MLRILTSLLLVIFITTHSKSQEVYTSIDSLNNLDTLLIMNEISVKAERVKTRSGFKVEKISEISSINNASKDLANIISSQTPIYINTQGEGNTATIKFRGTDASHTQVTWNGLSINSVSMGYLDFSQVPSFLIDHASVAYGSESLYQNNGSIGGSINLSSSLKWGDKNSTEIFSEYGANNTKSYGIKSFNRWGNFLTNNKIFYKSSDNNFKYLNKVRSMNEVYERRLDAEYKVLGFMQDNEFRINKYTYLSLHTWFQTNKRNLPDLVVNSYGYKFEDSENNSLKNILKFRHIKEDSKLTATLGSVREKKLYDRSFRNSNKYSTKNNTQTLFGKIDFNKEFSERASIAININNSNETMSASILDRPKETEFQYIVKDKEIQLFSKALDNYFFTLFKSLKYAGVDIKNKMVIITDFRHRIEKASSLLSRLVKL